MGLIQLLEDRKEIIRLGGEPPHFFDHTLLLDYLEEKGFRSVEHSPPKTKFFINKQEDAFGIISPCGPYNFNEVYGDSSGVSWNHEDHFWLDKVYGRSNNYYIFVQPGKINRHAEDFLKVYTDCYNQYKIAGWENVIFKVLIGIPTLLIASTFFGGRIDKSVNQRVEPIRKEFLSYNPSFGFEALEKLIQNYGFEKNRE